MTDQAQLAVLVAQALTNTFTQESLKPDAQASLLLGYCTLMRYVPAEALAGAQNVLLSAAVSHSRGPELVGAIRDLLANMPQNRIITTEH